MNAGGLQTRVAVLLALLALVIGGGGCALVAGVVAVLVLVRGVALPPKAWVALHLTALAGAGGVSLLIGYQEGLAVLVGWLLVHRAWTGRTASDARVSLLFATLLALLACLQTESPGLGLALLGFSGMLPAALLRIEVGEAPGAPSRGISTGVAVLALAGILFFLLPRLRGGYFAEGGGVGGAGTTVTLGDDESSGSSEIVARFRVFDAGGRIVAGPHYLRGRALDRFDGRTWTTTLGAADPTVPSISADDARAVVEVQPQPGGIVFGPPEVVGVSGLDAPAWRDRNGTWHHREGFVGVRLTARVRRSPAMDPPALAPAVEAALLDLPELDPRIATLAWSVAPDETDPRRIAQALTDHLSDDYRYVETPAAPAGDPLPYFLFVSQRGHCEYFASALAVLLRHRGIPARLATGFYTAEGDGEGWYVARTSHAHAWVEVPLSSGWTTFDPTPLGDDRLGGSGGLDAWLTRMEDRWVRLVVEYDLGDQFDGLDALGRQWADATGQESPTVPARSGLGVLAGGLLGVYALAVLAQLFGNVLLVKRDASPADALARQVAAARVLVARRGWSLPPGLPALAAAEWLVGEAGPAAEPFRQLARLVYAERYGGRAPRPEAVGEARKLVAALQALPPRRP